MQRMESCDAVIEKKEDLHAMRLRTALRKIDARYQVLRVLLAILESVHDQESGAEKRGDDHEPASKTAPIQLDGPNAERDQAAAHQQHGSFRRSQRHIGEAAGGGEALWMQDAHHRIADEQDAKKQYL